MEPPSSSASTAVMAFRSAPRGDSARRGGTARRHGEGTWMGSPDRSPGRIACRGASPNKSLGVSGRIPDYLAPSVAARLADEVERARRRRRAPSDARVPAGAGDRLGDGRVDVGLGAARRRGGRGLRCRRGRGARRGRRRGARRAAGTSASSIRAWSLSASTPNTSSTGRPGWRTRSAAASAAAPSGLCAPSRRTPLELLEPPRPARRRDAARRSRPRRRATPGARELRGAPPPRAPRSPAGAGRGAPTAPA